MKLTVRTAAVGAVLAATAVLAAPASASAADPKDGVLGCSAGKVCLFDGHSLTGSVLQLDAVDHRNIGPAWNDRAGSLWNRTDKHVCVWTDENFRGENWIIEPGKTQELMFAYDNSVTSIEVHYGFGCGG